jgi:hypothetical protein
VAHSGSHQKPPRFSFPWPDEKRLSPGPKFDFRIGNRRWCEIDAADLSATGVATDLGIFANTGTHNFTPPDLNDWVLVLDSNSAALPPPGTGDL